MNETTKEVISEVIWFIVLLALVVAGCMALGPGMSKMCEVTVSVDESSTIDTVHIEYKNIKVDAGETVTTTVSATPGWDVEVEFIDEDRIEKYEVRDSVTIWNDETVKVEGSNASVSSSCY